MAPLLFLIFVMLAALSAVGLLARLVLLGVWALAVVGFLGWLSVSPNAQIFPAAWWVLAAWVLLVVARLVRRLRRA